MSNRKTLSPTSLHKDSGSVIHCSQLEEEIKQAKSPASTIEPMVRMQTEGLPYNNWPYLSYSGLEVCKSCM